MSEDTETLTPENLGDFIRPEKDALQHIVRNTSFEGRAESFATIYRALDELAKFRASPSQPIQEERGGWRDISTAPRDGTPILIGRPEHDDEPAISTLGWWHDAEEDGVDYMGNDGGFVDHAYSCFAPGRSFGSESYRYEGRQPSHWMPLPEPPPNPSDMSDTWQPIETAPTAPGVEYTIKTQGGREFDVTYVDGFEREEGGTVCSWVAVNEDYPDCWTDGVYWRENADGVMSDPPTHWREPPAQQS